MKLLKFSFVVLSGIILASCQRESSSATGWEYNNPKVGGFEKVPFVDQETGPGLLLVEGGTFTMGRTENDVMYDWNNRATRVTVSSFYMDQTEVTNFQWLEYLYWISRAYTDYPMVYKNALPDTLCWRSPLAFNEKYVEYYLRHPAYRDYPVVGVSWLQANDFCKWRTDRVNEYILVREGILNWNIDQNGENTFNTESYFAGQHTVDEGEEQLLTDLNPTGANSLYKRGAKKFKNSDLGGRIARMEDGILLPRYRLPTEAEWEFAASGLIGNLQEGEENITDRRIYPWTGHWVRSDDEQFQGDIRANFVRGRGDYMGVAGSLNDGADVTAPVEAYWPNDYGLYNMAGNVSEWVMDVYRPLSSEDFDEFRPFRGNVFKTKLLNNEGNIEARNTMVQYDVHGMKEYINEFERVRFQRISAEKHDPKDPYITKGLDSMIASRNSMKRTFSPDPFYISSGKKKDTMELNLLTRINRVIDSAIVLKNLKYDNEASTLIQEGIFDDIFGEVTRGEEVDATYAFEIISMLRDGFNDYIIDTPGKLKYRNVTEEENIGRLNYRKDDYIDYLDGDVENSVFYDNLDYRNDVNQAKRDPNLAMYQNEHEQYGLDGTPLKPEGRPSWPTTLISDKSRVYKGGSWRDRAYWLATGNRRFLDEDKSTCTIGFRCAMDRIGSPTGMNYDSKKKKKG